MGQKQTPDHPKTLKLLCKPSFLEDPKSNFGGHVRQTIRGSIAFLLPSRQCQITTTQSTDVNLEKLSCKTHPLLIHQMTSLLSNAAFRLLAGVIKLVHLSYCIFQAVVAASSPARLLSTASFSASDSFHGFGAI